MTLDLEPIPGTPGVKWDYTFYVNPVHHRTICPNINIWGKIEFERLEEIHADIGKTAQVIN